MCNFGTISAASAAKLCWCSCCSKDVITGSRTPPAAAAAADVVVSSSSDDRNLDFFAVLEHHAYQHFVEAELESIAAVSTPLLQQPPPAIDADSSPAEVADANGSAASDAQATEEEDDGDVVRTDRVVGLDQVAALLSLSVISHLNIAARRRRAGAAPFHLQLLLVQDTADHCAFALKERLHAHLRQLERAHRRRQSPDAATETDSSSSVNSVNVVVLLVCFLNVQRVRSAHDLLVRPLHEEVDCDEELAGRLQLRSAFVCPQTHSAFSSLVLERTTYALVEIVSSLSHRLCERRWAHEPQEQRVRGAARRDNGYGNGGDGGKKLEDLSVALLSDHAYVHGNMRELFGGSRDFTLCRVE